MSAKVRSRFRSGSNRARAAISVKVSPPGRRPRVEPLPQAAQADALLLQVPHDGEEVGQVTAQPVQTPDHEDIAPAQLLERSVEFGPLLRRARDVIGEDPLAAVRLEGGCLQVRILVDGGDAA